MSKQSRARATTKAATSVQTSAATGAQASAAASAQALPAGSAAPTVFSVRWDILLAGGIIVLAALAAYHNSFSGPFVLDDQLAITDNPTIRHLGSALSPPATSTTGGRPLINLTFALNYALDGVNVRGYHAFNLLIHMLAGLTLFGLVRRTLLRLRLRRAGLPAPSQGAISQEPSFTEATLLALAVAVIWVVHPLQTEAVTYISQRAEALMGLFYLLTLYCFLRGVESKDQVSGGRGQKTEGQNSALQLFSPSVFWLSASILSCLLGAMSKEIIVTAPVMVLLYDRTFFAGSFREAWRLRWRYYLGLVCTWLLLARLMTGMSQRNIGFDPRVTWWIYALTSCRSVVLYCKLALWPHPLLFYYGINYIWHATAAVPYALVLMVLLTTVVIALRYRPPIGFAGAWFFVIFAPTTSVISVFPLAEHRLYLSLAGAVALGVLGLHRLIGRWGLMVCAAAAVGLGCLSVQRNNDYRSELALWSDTVAKFPDNAWAHHNEGRALRLLGRLTEAREQLEIALRIQPDLSVSYNDLGVIADQAGQTEEAINNYTQAVRLQPGFADARYNLAVDLGKLGRLPEAIEQYREVVRKTPDDFMAHFGLGGALAQQGHPDEALAQFEEVVRITPESAEAHYNLGTAFIALGRFTDALGEYKIAIKIKPDFVEAHYNLGNTLVQLGRLPEAVGQYELTLQLKPDHEGARKNLEQARKAMAGPAAGAKK